MTLPSKVGSLLALGCALAIACGAGGARQVVTDYDYYRSCNKGACMSPREPVRFSLQPHEKRTIASVQISPRGGNCVAPLAPGHYEIAPIAPDHELEVCVIAARLDVPGGASARETTP